MSLKDKLRGLGNKEADTYLVGVWKSFQGTEAFEALELLFNELQEKGAATILTPTATESQRTFAAGMLAGLAHLNQFIKAAVAFDPTKAKYDNEEADSPAEEPEEEEAVEVVY